MNRLKEKYQSQVAPKLQEKFGLKNVMAIPRLEKVTLNVGLSVNKDEKLKEIAPETLRRISGQKPIVTRARKSIAAFKIREGMPVGAKVTLRGEKMYSFVDKLISIALPRVRDFRGVNEKVVDQSGNLSLGFKEHLVFGELNPDAVEKIHGLEVTITTSAKNRQQGLELFRLLGFPFKKSLSKPTQDHTQTSAKAKSGELRPGAAS
jgi:large subunit ribosomal protein L5